MWFSRFILRLIALGFLAIGGLFVWVFFPYRNYPACQVGGYIEDHCAEHGMVFANILLFAFIIWTIGGLFAWASFKLKSKKEPADAQTD